MNSPIPVSATPARLPKSCCLAHVRLVLASMRSRHQVAGDETSDSVATDRIDAHHEECHAPTSHDRYAAELENSLVALPVQETAIRHDDSQEIARARLIFAASLALPLLLIAAVLGVPGWLTDRATLSLLHFAELALATPLLLALIFSKPAVRSGRMTRFPPRIPLRLAVTFAYVVGVLSWSLSAFSVVAPIGFSLVGLLTFSTRVREWVLASRIAIR